MRAAQPGFRGWNAALDGGMQRWTVERSAGIPREALFPASTKNSRLPLMVAGAGIAPNAFDCQPATTQSRFELKHEAQVGGVGAGGGRVKCAYACMGPFKQCTCSRQGPRQAAHIPSVGGDGPLV